MTATETSPTPIIDIEQLSFEQGAHLLVKRALAQIPVGGRLGVKGHSPELPVHLRAWCRAQGHEVFWNEAPACDANTSSPLIAWVVRGSSSTGRWRGAQQAGMADARLGEAVVNEPPNTWGLAARGAKVEAGGPAFHFQLDTKAAIWADSAPKLYAQAAAAQWQADSAINWSEPFENAPEIEQAVVQVMTYLIENENAALLVPAKFLAQIHPHFREVMQLLALQVADEARHIEVFTRRIALRNCEPGLSAVSGQQSLKTLLDEPDFALASFLLSVLGEGTFLNLLWFLEKHAPDPVTRQIARLVAQDEARHVAFGLSHLQYQIALEPALRERLAAAINRRHDALANTTGLNEEVFDALVILAAGDTTPGAIATGFAKVQSLKEEMHAARQARLLKLGFGEAEAAALSALHTRNFM